MAYRAVIYIKINDFFAEVERQRRPDLAGNPVVVGRSLGNTCIVVSASAEARSAGVSEGITVRHAQRLCPDAAIVKANASLYREVFDQVLWILSKYSPLLEPHNSDAAFLDVTAVRRLFGGPVKIAKEAAACIGAETGLGVSIGIATNKLVAQLAGAECGVRSAESVSPSPQPSPLKGERYFDRPGYSSVAKVSGFESGDRSAICNLQSAIRVVSPAKEEAFLSPFPVESLRGVGDKTARRLNDLGVRTIGELARVPERLLVKQFGAIGKTLYRHARGIDYSRVESAFPPEVIIIEHTFPQGVQEPAEIEAALAIMAEKLSRQLKTGGRSARTVTLTLIPNSKFPVVRDMSSRTHVLPDLQSVHSTLNIQHSTKRPISTQTEILAAASRLLRKLLCEGEQSEVRNAIPIAPDMYPGRRCPDLSPVPSTLNPQPSTFIGVILKLSDLRIPAGLQLGLLEISERDHRLDLVMESIRARFGDASIRPAAALRLEGRRAVLSRLAL